MLRSKLVARYAFGILLIVTILSYLIMDLNFRFIIFFEHILIVPLVLSIVTGFHIYLQKRISWWITFLVYFFAVSLQLFDNCVLLITALHRDHTFPSIDYTSIFLSILVLIVVLTWIILFYPRRIKINSSVAEILDNS